MKAKNIFLMITIAYLVVEITLLIAMILFADTANHNAVYDIYHISNSVRTSIHGLVKLLLAVNSISLGIITPITVFLLIKYRK